MKTEDEIEGWYEEEKKKGLETYFAALEQKQDKDAAEKKYSAQLKALFEKYKKLKIGLLQKSAENAKIAAAAKAMKKQSPLNELKDKLGKLIKKVKK